MIRFLLTICVLTGSFAAVGHAGEIIAKQSLRVGAIIAPGDLVLSDPDNNADQDRLVGMTGLEVRRAIVRGRAVRSHQLGPPTQVRRNKSVIMHFRQAGIGLRTEGRALSSGTLGDVIEVMNLDSRLTVRAEVIGRNQVEVRR
jgi:flagella basal body P-ring formation protein FlgA